MKKLLVVLAVLAGIVLSGCVGDNDMAEPVIFTFGWDNSESYYCMRTYTLDGVFVSSFECEEHPEDTCMAVDVNDNVYYVDAATGYDIIRKRNRDGTLLLSKATTYSTRLCMSPDGYVCELGLDSEYNACIIKRDPDTLNIVSKMCNIDQDLGHYEGFTCDADGYFYMVNRGPDVIEKWDFDSGIMVASHEVPWTTITRLAVVGNLVAGNFKAMLAQDSYVWTIPTSLDEDVTEHILTSLAYPKAIASIENIAFLVGGYDNSDGPYIVGKYTSALVKIWTIGDIPNEDNLYGVAAYPFLRVVDKEAPWKEDTLEPTGEVKVEIPRRSGEWTTLPDIMRIHTSNGKDTSSPRAPIEIGQAEVTCSNIDKDFNSFEEASDWYKNLEGYAVQIKVGCKVEGSPISVKLFTGIISSVNVDRLSQTAEIRVVDFLDYFGRITIEETPVWEGISLTQLFKNLVQLAFPEWVEGTDYFVEDLGGSTIPAIGYTDLNLLSELKMIAESRGMRLYTDTSGRLHCASRNPERDPLTVSYDYNLEDVTERRDIDTVLNWVVVHARPHEILPDTTPPGRIAGFTATPGDNKIDLSWSNPTDDDFEKVLIRYSATAYPLNRNDGTQIYEGTGEAKEHTGLTNGQRYYYSAWTKDTTGNWSDAAQTSGIAGVGGDTWADDTGTSRVSMFDAEPQSQKIILTWYNPNIANFDKVVIRRSTTGYPDSPTSGSSVYEGTAETTTDTGLSNGTRYYYSAFVKNTAGDYSGAAFASAETPSIIRTREMIQSQNITGYGILGPQTGAYGTSYSKKVLLRFGGLRGKYSTEWLKFKHQWDIKVNSGPKYSSNQKHEYGAEDDLALGFTKNIGGVAGVTVTKIRVTTSEVQVEYKLVYIGGKALSISFSNKLSLWG